MENCQLKDLKLPKKTKQKNKERKREKQAHLIYNFDYQANEFTYYREQKIILTIQIGKQRISIVGLFISSLELGKLKGK